MPLLPAFAVPMPRIGRSSNCASVTLCDDVAAFRFQQRGFRGDSDRFGVRADFEREIERQRLAGIHGDTRAGQLLEAGGGHRDAVRSGRQLRDRVGACVGRRGWDKRRWCPRFLTSTGALGTTAPAGS